MLRQGPVGSISSSISQVLVVAVVLVVAET